MNNERIYYSRDAEAHAMRRMTVITVLCLTTGLGVGMALALLFAPNTGEKTRKILARNVEEGLHNGRESIDPLIKRLEDQFNDLRKQVEDRVKQS